jgi:molecular chaperone DnaK (HSP70)
MPVFGIDLGTTNFCIGMWDVKAQNVMMIPERGDTARNTVPSAVFCDPAASGGGDGAPGGDAAGIPSSVARIVGAGALGMSSSSLSHRLFTSTKRLIGRRFGDAQVQELAEKLPYKVLRSGAAPGAAGRAGDEGEATASGQGIALQLYADAEKAGLEAWCTSPEEIAAEILRHLKHNVVAHLGWEPSMLEGADVVITVPAHFNSIQREATRNAATIAGWHVLELMNEPTAAAMAYGVQAARLDALGEDEECLLVFDLGGGTFDVSILTNDEGMLEVLSTAGSQFLGGDDVDALLLTEWCRMCEVREEDLGEYRTPLLRDCRRGKEGSVGSTVGASNLISLDATEVPGLGAAPLHGVDIGPGAVERILGPFLEQVRGKVDEAFIKAEGRVKKGNVQKVMMVGGSSRLPACHDLVTRMFPGCEVYDRINPDEAVAMGAAAYAAQKAGELTGRMDELMIVDVTSLSLGVGVTEGRMSTIVKHNTNIPAEVTKRYETAAHEQTEVTFRVFEGDRPLVCDNQPLGELSISGLPPRPRGEVEIDVTFGVHPGGMMEVTAKLVDDGRKVAVTIDRRSTASMPAADVARLKEVTATAAESDKQRLASAAALATLRNLCQDLRYHCHRARRSEVWPEIQEKVEKQERWLKDHGREYPEASLVTEHIQGLVTAVEDPALRAGLRVSCTGVTMGDAPA